MNPVLFDQFESHDNLVMLAEDLSEFQWKNRIVGFSDTGILYASTKTAQSGFYTFTPTCVEWADVRLLKVTTKIAILGMLGGTIAIFIGFCAFWAGWVAQTHTGPGVFVMPILFPLGGLVLIFGGKRNFISGVTSEGVKIKWISGPLLATKESIRKCDAAVVVARKNRVNISGKYAAG